MRNKTRIQNYYFGEFKHKGKEYTEGRLIVKLLYKLVK